MFCLCFFEPTALVLSCGVVPKCIADEKCHVLAIAAMDSLEEYLYFSFNELLFTYYIVTGVEENTSLH